MILKNWARLYTNQTEPEQILEPVIAALGERYRCQHPFFSLRHITDFALLDRKLIIEVDGKSHSQPAQIKKDLEHTIALKALGWEVIRVSNEDAKANPWGTIQAALEASPQTETELRQSLAKLRQDYPKLFVEKPRRKRQKKASAGKRGEGRRKPRASGGQGRAYKRPKAASKAKRVLSKQV